MATGTDFTNAVITDMTSRVSDYSVPQETTDGINEAGETVIDYPKFTQWYAYYKRIPHFQTPINNFVDFLIGMGWEAEDDRTKVILDRMTGIGEDTFSSLLWNHLVVELFNGDAFSEIVKNSKGILLNLKPLDPESMRTILNNKGLIVRYEQMSKVQGNKPKIFKPEKIFHTMNNRVADNGRGTALAETVEWILLALNQALDDNKTVMHRNKMPLRIIEVDFDDKTKLAKIKKDYEDLINKDEVMIVPKGNVEIKDFVMNPQNALEWIGLLERTLEKQLGVPSVQVSNASEAGSKIGFMTFTPKYTRKVNELTSDLWNQLAIRIKINKPPSLESELQQTEIKNSSQTGFQPNDIIAGRGE